MKIWTNNKFNGHWPVGAAAVIVANSSIEASKFLSARLKEEGLDQDIPEEDMIPFSISNGKVRILTDGNY